MGETQRGALRQQEVAAALVRDPELLRCEEELLHAVAVDGEGGVTAEVHTGTFRELAEAMGRGRHNTRPGSAGQAHPRLAKTCLSRWQVAEASKPTTFSSNRKAGSCSGPWIHLVTPQGGHFLPGLNPPTHPLETLLGGLTGVK